MNLYQKMAAISAAIKEVQKDLTLGDGDRQYSATSEAAVLSAVKPKEAEFGVYSYPANRTFDNQIVEKEYVWNGETRKARLVVCNVTTTYRFVNVENPDECLETVSFGTGIDTGDKAPGKAMTYADKYALMKAYKISNTTQDDPDATPSPEGSFDAPVPAPIRNPMMPNQPAMTAAASTESAVRSPAAPASAPAAVSSAPVQVGMTAEKARAVLIPGGQYAGKTMGEALALNRGIVEFYASEKYSGRARHPEVHEAAKAVLMQ